MLILCAFRCRISSVVGLANIHAISVPVYGIVQRDLIGELVDEWPLTVLDRVWVDFCFLKILSELDQGRWLFQLLLRYMDILFFNDKVGGAFITLGKENRDTIPVFLPTTAAM